MWKKNRTGNNIFFKVLDTTFIECIVKSPIYSSINMYYEYNTVCAFYLWTK